MTQEQDREDLQHHWDKCCARESFSYALIHADATELIGCVYIDPTDKPAADADNSWWAREVRVGRQSRYLWMTRCRAESPRNGRLRRRAPWAET